VVAALTLLPAKLLGPAPHRDPLALPATIPVQPVHIALPRPKPHHAVVQRRAATPPPSAAVLAVVRTPIVSAPRPAPVQHHVLAAKVTHTPLVSPRRLQRPRLPRQELRPKPAPAPPAPTVTAPVVQAVAPTPAPQLAAPATTTTVAPATAPAPPPVLPDHKKDHGHGKGHDR
jgi:hypothetical protein